jgi:MFS family permease
VNFGPSRVGRVEIAFLFGAIAIGCAGYMHECHFPSAFDSIGYVDSGNDIVSGGLFSNYANSELRTYGYPWILSLFLRARVAWGLPFAASLFVFQLAAYIFAAWFVRWSLLPMGRRVAAFAFCGLLSNYYVLLYTSVSLTESLSLAMLLLVAGCWIAMWQGRDRNWPILIGSLAAGFAIMIRPANVFVLAAWVAGSGYLVVTDTSKSAHRVIRVVALIVLMAVPMIPQVANNVRFHQRFTPLVAESLGNLQQILGIRLLKYATALPPVPEASVSYANPLYRGEPIDHDAPLLWYAEHPVRGTVTLLLHVFNLTDQDLLFTYSRDLDPWYRSPLSTLNHLAAGLGILGLMVFLVSAAKSRERRSIESIVALMSVLLANIALYSVTAVEMRFGLTLLAILFSFAGFAGWWLLHVSGGRRGVATGGVLAYVALALVLSVWVRRQSPEIREAMSTVAPRPQPSCPAKFDFSAQPMNGTGWSIPERQPDGSFRMWMANTRASMELRTTCAGPVEVSLAVAGYMAVDILSGLALRVDGTVVSLQRGRSADGKIWLIGRTVLPSDGKNMELSLHVPRTIVPDHGSRELAVMFSDLTVAPVRPRP